MALMAIWQFTGWAVQARMVYGPKQSWGPYRSSLDWTFRKLHIARKYMFYFLYYTESMD